MDRSEARLRHVSSNTISSNNDIEHADVYTKESTAAKVHDHRNKGFLFLFRRFRLSGYNFGKALVYGVLVNAFVFAWRSRLIPLMNDTTKLDNSTTVAKEKFVVNTFSAPTCKTLEYTDVSFTLVTQTSQDRLWMIQHHCLRWGINNPISIAVFTDYSVSDIIDEMHPACDPLMVTIKTLSPTGVSQADYPINTLRNLALSGVTTTHVIYIDIDFWPSENLYQLLNWNETKHQFAHDDKLAVVVPAFSVPREASEMMPSTFSDVTNLLKKKMIAPFDITNRGGHGSTLYAKWFYQEEGYLLDLPCVKSNRYEPYMAFRYCQDLPPFQEVFTGYGKNKMTFVMQMRRIGYVFSQLGTVFLVHYPHEDSKARMIWNRGPEDEELRNVKNRNDMKNLDLTQYKRGQNDQLFVEFRSWMDKNVDDMSRLQSCTNITDDDSRLWVTSKS